MRDELELLGRWQHEAGEVVLATVTSTSSSAPLGPGSTLGMHPDGQVIGSVSGGCVEGAVVEVAQQVLADGHPQHVTYGVTDEAARAVGLTCGGTLSVLVRRVPRATVDLATLSERVRTEVPTALITIVEAGDTGVPSGVVGLVSSDAATDLTGDATLDAALRSIATDMLAHGVTGLRHLGARGERSGNDLLVFVESFASRPQLLIFGAIDFAGALASVGRFLGYHVTVCDARARFATRLRFPDADEIVVQWPHRFLEETSISSSTAICVLTHDPKFDVPALLVALDSPAGYVGVMGSRRTHEDRLQRLREAGATPDALERLRSPIGLDLGGRTPQETAVSIAAELVLHTHGGSGQPLAETRGPIHRTATPERSAVG